MAPRWDFLGVVDETSKITTFKDDRGTDLLHKGKYGDVLFFVGEGTLFTREEKLTVPVDLKVGVGL
jgi:hypothetical protein